MSVSFAITLPGMHSALLLKDLSLTHGSVPACNPLREVYTNFKWKVCFSASYHLPVYFQAVKNEPPMMSGVDILSQHFIARNRRRSLGL